MTELEKAARQALEALEQWNTPLYKRGNVITALRRALEQQQPAQQQEPVGLEQDLLNLLCRIHRDGGHYIAKHGLRKAIDDANTKVSEFFVKPDVASEEAPPASKPWVGLTTNELDEIDAPIRERGHATIAEIYRAIEAKLREKNTGEKK